MNTKRIPLHRWLPDLPEDLFRSEAVFELFARHCPVLMRDAVRALQANRPETNLIAYFGFEIRPGHLTGVYLLCRRIERIAKKMQTEFGEEMTPCLHQVKEKFGSLRVYLRPKYEMPDSVIAERLARIESMIDETDQKYFPRV